MGTSRERQEVQASRGVRSAAEPWALAGPGMAHSLGNLLFTIRGRASLMRASAERGAMEAPAFDVLENVLDRADVFLAAFRALVSASEEERAEPAITDVSPAEIHATEPHASKPVIAIDVLDLVVDWFRIGLRDEQIRVRLKAPETGRDARQVDPGVVVPAILQLLHATLLDVPSGTEAVVTVALEPPCSMPNRVRISLITRPAPGALPFPLGGVKLTEALRWLAAKGLAWERVSGGVEIWFAAPCEQPPG